GPENTVSQPSIIRGLRASLGVRGFRPGKLFDQFPYLARQRSAAETLCPDDAILIYQDGMWNPPNAVKTRYAGLGTCPIIDLRPRDAFRVQIALQRSAISIEADSHDDELIAAILLPNFLDCQHVFPAGAAPGGPEIQQDDLSF